MAEGRRSTAQPRNALRGADEQELTYDADDHLVRIADPAGTDETLWDFDAAGRRVRREDRTASVATAAHRAPSRTSRT